PGTIELTIPQRTVHERNRPMRSEHPDPLKTTPESVHEALQTTPHIPGREDEPVVPGYEVLGRLGQGGMGEVLRVHDPDHDRPLALKVMRAELAQQPGAESRFVEEARITGRLQHPGIPPVHELGRLDDGRPFLAMKLIEGRTLHELLKERPTPADALPRFVAI